jgi:hypothetical protein
LTGKHDYKQDSKGNWGCYDKPCDWDCKKKECEKDCSSPVPETQDSPRCTLLTILAAKKYWDNGYCKDRKDDCDYKCQQKKECEKDCSSPVPETLLFLTDHPTAKKYWENGYCKDRKDYCDYKCQQKKECEKDG